MVADQMQGSRSVSSKTSSYERLCYPGSSVLGCVTVNSYELSTLRMDNVITKTFSTETEYLEKGCHLEHRNCRGHLCRTPAGVLMYPGSECTVVGDIRDQFYEVAMPLLNPRIGSTGDEYANSISSLMLGKTGILRGKCCGGVVEGSLRMVIIPSWELKQNEIFVPRYVRDSLLIPSRVRSGVLTPIYDYVKLEEGDYAVVVRPPSLTESSTQPMKVRFWDRTALGFCPENCSEYHADFDGDEVQLYFLKDPRSTKECAAWSMQTKER